MRHFFETFSLTKHAIDLSQFHGGNGTSQGKTFRGVKGVKGLPELLRPRLGGRAAEASPRAPWTGDMLFCQNIANGEGFLEIVKKWGAGLMIDGFLLVISSRILSAEQNFWKLFVVSVVFFWVCTPSVSDNSETNKCLQNKKHMCFGLCSTLCCTMCFPQLVEFQHQFTLSYMSLRFYKRTR